MLTRIPAWAVVACAGVVGDPARRATMHELKREMYRDAVTLMDADMASPADKPLVQLSML